MNPSEAREHLDLVDRILTRGDGEICIAADFFVVWGIVAAIIDIVVQLILGGKIGPNWLALPMASLALGIIYSIFRGRQLKRSSERQTLMQREYLNIIWLAVGVIAVAQLGAFRLFDNWSGAALWTVAASIVTFYVALHGNRRALLGGIVLLASLFVANFTPHLTGYVLAAGMLVGYTGFGVAALLARD